MSCPGIKKIFVCVCAALCFAHLNALPGVKDFLPTESGQYVYYRDSTFTHPVYIGFLQYDEGSYAVRYYAPEAQSGSKEITLFFTLDTEKDYVAMTGEKIEQTLQNEDSPTVNYLHDLFYEFNKCRQKIAPENLLKKGLVPAAESQNADIRIFGGPVRLVYDYLIPLFNISEIKTADNKSIFSAVTMGQLLSSEDNSFSNFKGFSDKADKQEFSLTAKDLIAEGITGPVKNAGKKDKVQKSAISASQNEQMDGEYRAVADNLGFWGSEALMYTDLIEAPADFFKDKAYGLSHVLSRSLSFGSDESYMYAKTQTLSQDGYFSVLVNQSYDGKTGRFFINIALIGEKQYGTAVIVRFSAAHDYFIKHRRYFIQKIGDTVSAFQL